MEKRIMVTLTPAESKRLIAKWVAVMPMVKRALEDGIVSLQMSSSNGYIYEEITGKHINKSNHMCGFLSAAGGCGAYLPDVIKRVSYFEKGKEKFLSFPLGAYDELYQRMGSGDIVIKSGNLLDRNGKAGVFAGEPDGEGGEWGRAFRYVKKNGIQVIVPMTLNKTANVDLERAMELADVNKMDWTKNHVMASLWPLPGVVVTEIEAIKGLCGADAMPVAMSGVGTGEGTVTLCVYGEAEAVDRTWELVTSIKGEPQLVVEQRCLECLALTNQGRCVAKQRVFTRT